MTSGKCPVARKTPTKRPPPDVTNEILVEKKGSAVAESGRIAADSLRSNYRRVRGGRTIIVCGPRAYQHVHARDFAFAAGGALLLGDFAAVRDTLEALLSFQRRDGLFPRAVAPWLPYVGVVIEYLGVPLEFKRRLRANFVSEHFAVNVDCNALLAWTAERYAEASGDWDFAGRQHDALARGIAWYERWLRPGRGLVSQPHHSDWQDMIARTGRVFYTNVCYWRGLVAMERLARGLGRPAEAEAWRARADRFRERARAFFWDGAVGAFRNAEGIAGIEPGANLLALAWDFADAREADEVLAALEREGAWRRPGARDVPRLSAAVEVVVRRARGERRLSRFAGVVVEHGARGLGLRAPRRARPRSRDPAPDRGDRAARRCDRRGVRRDGAGAALARALGEPVQLGGGDVAGGGGRAGSSDHRGIRFQGSRVMNNVPAGYACFPGSAGSSTVRLSPHFGQDAWT